jgi:sporulation protein YlmC with PRC-barrel domain
MSPKQLSLLAATALALAPLAAAAQQGLDVATLEEAEDDDLVVQPFGLTVDDIDDMDVMNADGEEIGEIEEVLLDASGQPVAVSVEVDDFLGIDDREVVFGLDQLQLTGDDFVTSVDRATVEALPEWDD